MCGGLSAEQPGSYFSVWWVEQQRFLTSEQPDAFALVIKFTWSLIKVAIHTFSVITVPFTAFFIGSAASHFRWNYSGTIIYHQSIIIWETSAAYIFVSSFRASNVCTHTSCMHLCKGYFDWCHIKWAHYKPCAYHLLDSHDHHIIFFYYIISAKHLAPASFWGTHEILSG